MEICFLYSVCSTPVSCSSVCTSGPVFPDLSSCDESEEDTFDTLVLGGLFSSGGYDISVELITANRTCSPQMDQLPVSREDPAAAVLGSRIFFCGGHGDGHYQRSCHSYSLDLEDGKGWQEEASMVLEKSGFGLSVIGDMLISSGGYGNDGSLSSVEVFTLEEDMWTLEPMLDMGLTKYSHCSVALGSWLYTIGGLVDGYYSDRVDAIDTSLMSTNDSISWARSNWVMKARMNERRWALGCHAGVFEGQEGIYVAGGRDGSAHFSASAEFYNLADDTWHEIGSLYTARAYSPMTILGGNLIMSGGNNPHYLTSVETWNGSSWSKLTNLMVERTSHAAVSIRAGKLSCT